MYRTAVLFTIEFGGVGNIRMTIGNFTSVELGVATFGLIILQDPLDHLLA